MRLPVDWLNEYLEKKLPTRKLAAALEAAGLEIEEIAEAPMLDSKIVVGLVTAARQHPNADKLKVTEVEVKGKTLRIVCGAPNVAAGQKVPVALVGATLPDGTRIAAAKLRGEESQGMICSESELGLGDNHTGIMVLAPTAEIGGRVSDMISSSDVIDTTSAANRWDLNGILWVAHEAAAQTGQMVVQTTTEHPIGSKPPAVKIAAPKLADRYMLRQLEVEVDAPTPIWMQQRLQAAGVRSINVVVDITNYVMLEYGQPLHAFDAAKVKLPVCVRLAKKGERLVTLDGETRRLDESDLLITDAAGPIGFAGVMGGKNSEVDDATRAIYLEAASFNGTSIRKTAQRHGLRTDSSARFERGLPVDLAPLGLARAVELLTKYAGAKPVGGVADHLQAKPVTTKISAQTSRISGLLGLELSAKQIATHLTALQFEVKASAKEDLLVTAPWWRPDIQTPEDLAEEVIKLVGYDQLPATLPVWRPTAIQFDSAWPKRWQAKAALRSLGLFEVTTYSFISEEQIRQTGRDAAGFLKLDNPLSVEQAYLRTDLLPSLLATADRNRTYDRQFGMYEFSRVYQPQKAGALPEEPLRLAVLVRTPNDAYRRAKAVLDRLSADFNVGLDIRPASPELPLGHPTRTAVINLDGTTIGWIGQLHPALVASTKLGGEVGYLELDWEPLAAAARPRQHRRQSRFPAVKRDLSVVVDREVSWQEVRQALSEFEPAFLNDYYGPNVPKGQKALALRLSFSASDRTLTDAEADKTLGKVIKRLEQKFQARART